MFSWQASGDPTQICTSAGTDEGLLEGGQGRRPREKENIPRGFCPLWSVLGQWHICTGQRDVCHLGWSRVGAQQKSEENWTSAPCRPSQSACFWALSGPEMMHRETGALLFGLWRLGWGGIQIGSRCYLIFSFSPVHFSLVCFLSPGEVWARRFSGSGWAKLNTRKPSRGLRQQREVSKITAELLVNQRIISPVVQAFTSTAIFYP